MSARAADDCRRHALFKAKPSNEPSRTECLIDRKRADIRLSKRTRHCRGAVGTSTRAVACAFASQAQLLCANLSEPSLDHKNLLIDCGDDLLSNDLALNSSTLLFWRSSVPAASDVVKLPVLGLLSSSLGNVVVSLLLPSSSSTKVALPVGFWQVMGQENTTPQRGVYKRLASAEQHRPRRPGLRLRRDLLLHHRPRLDRRRHGGNLILRHYDECGARSVLRSSSSAFRVCTTGAL